MADKMYNAEQEQILLSVYDREADQDTRDKQVAQLSKELDKPVKSIIAKLSRMKVYKAKVRTTKTGEPITKKSDLVAKIAKGVGVEVSAITSLEKATKLDLSNLVEALGE